MPLPSGRSVGQKEIGNGIAAISTNSTAVTTTDTWVKQIVVANTTGGAVTLLVTDGQGSPVTLVPTVSLAANTLYVTVFPDYVKLTSGVKWQAGSAGLTGEIFGYKI